jgi:hypothetical protein
MFYLRENLFVARLLRRTLILPKVLRTQNPQSCTDVAVCDAHFPKTEDGNYDIPLVLLWDVAVLREAGAVVADLPPSADESAAAAGGGGGGLVVTRVAAADERCGASARWTDEVPSAGLPDRTVLKPCNRNFNWYAMELNNDMEPIKVNDARFEHGQRRKVRGVLNVFGSGGDGSGGGGGSGVDYSRARVLDLSSCGIWFPDSRSLHFSSFARYEQFRVLALRSFVPSHAIVAAARDLLAGHLPGLGRPPPGWGRAEDASAGHLLGVRMRRRGRTEEVDASSMCLHWRRGDYVEQWPEISHTGLVNLLTDMPKYTRRFKTFLVSTNERDPEILCQLKDTGGGGGPGAR